MSLTELYENTALCDVGFMRLFIGSLAFK